MRTSTKTVLYAVAAILAAVSCQKSVEPSAPIENGKETIEISINGLMGEYAQGDATKASMVNTVRVSWEGGETIYVYDGTRCLGSLAASLEEGEDRYALISTDDAHTVETPADGTTKLTLVYCPLLTEAPAVEDGAISISLANQDCEKVPFVAYATLDYNGEDTIEKTIVPFQFATSVIRINCTGLRANTAIENAILSNVNTVCSLSLSGTAAPAVAGSENGIIKKTGDAAFAAGMVNLEGVAVFQMAVPAFEAASESRVLTVSQGSDYFEYRNFSKKSLPVATSVNTVCQMVDLRLVLSGEFSVADGKKVRFSRGNLQATFLGGSDPTNYSWGFAENQYDVIGTTSGNATIDNQTPGAVVDLFGWSTEATYYGISTETDPSGSESTHYSGDFKDWGTAVDNIGTWRTLSYSEILYLINERSASTVSDIENARFAKGMIGDIKGIFLLPDVYFHPNGLALMKGVNLENDSFSNKYTKEEWTKMEMAGCVFIPYSYARTGSSLRNDVASEYWLSIRSSGVSSYVLCIGDDEVRVANLRRYYGNPVRLVTDVKE